MFHNISGNKKESSNMLQVLSHTVLTKIDFDLTLKLIYNLPLTTHEN